MKTLKEMIYDTELENNPFFNKEKLQNLIDNSSESNLEQWAIDLGIIPNPECD